ncbi:MAG: serine--tRNA ligase, partial [Bacteroidales bacterium]
MLTLKLFREQPNFVIERLAVKNFDAKKIINDILAADELRRSSQTQMDAILATQNAKAKEIGLLMKGGKKAEAEEIKQEVANLKEKSKLLETQMEDENKKMLNSLVLLPNLPCADVPNGKGAEDNIIVREGGVKPTLCYNALP